MTVWFLAEMSVRTVGSVGEETAKSIKKVAVELIAEHGFEAMSLRQLAQQVGLQAGSLYNHISGKQALLQDLLRGVMTELLEEFRAEVAGVTDPVEQLRCFVNVHIRFHTDRRNEVGIATTELRSLDAKGYREVVKLRGAYEKHLFDILDRGQNSGVFAVPNSKIAAYSIIATLTGVSLWYREGGELQREEIIRIYTELVLRMAGIAEHASSRGKPINSSAGAPGRTIARRGGAT